MTFPTEAGRIRRWWPERALARGGALVAGAILISGALGGWTRHARPTGEAVLPDVGFVTSTMTDLTSELEDARGQLAMHQIQLERANAIVGFSSKYQIPADLAASIYDIALSEGIDPGIGFRLVHVESNFKRTARSGAEALGYTQLRVQTARFYEPGITERGLLDRDTNLRIGFRFLKDLMAQYGNDLSLALLAYNRGPARVNEILASGGDPANGYSEWVMTGKRPETVGATQ